MKTDYSNNMGIWFEQGILDALRAVSFASNSVTSLVPTPEAKIYQKGFDAAIIAMAHAFGVQADFAFSPVVNPSDF